MKKIFFLITGLIFICTNNYSQSNLFISKEFKKAYENKTRSFNGKPGDNYFQNKANYNINVELLLKTGTIKGTETITYFNNSPDSLNYIVIRNYQDFYKKGNKRNMSCNAQDLHNGVKIKSISAILNNKNNNINLYRTMGTNKIYTLENSIPPNKSLKIKISWEFKMPKKSKIRYGTYDSTTYFVAYWYPQISVYDDISGWYIQNFNGEQEFYNEFGNFDVKITVPGNQIVWATGLLQNKNNIFRKKYISRLNKAQISDDIIKIISKEDLNNPILKSAKYHTWHFKAENVNDFAFATSDHYLWDATSIENKKNSGKRVLVSAVYPVDAFYFDKVAEISKQTIDIMSNEVLDVAFPFPEITIFNGGTKGMEFPMLVNDDDFNCFPTTVFVTSHEVSHSYFPFYVGTNENQTAWLDEGLVTLLPKEVEKRILKNDKTYLKMIRIFSKHGGRQFEVPLMCPSYALNSYSYNFQAYSRPANAFWGLKQLLGDELFKQCLKTFINRWKGKHPTGYDFFYTVEDVLNENLEWFWKPWFFEFGFADLHLIEAEQNNNDLFISVEKKGNLPVPVFLTIYFQDGSKKIIKKNARVWQKNNVFKTKLKTNKKIISVELGNKYIPDSYTDNNKLTIVAP